MENRPANRKNGCMGCLVKLVIAMFILAALVIALVIFIPAPETAPTQDDAEMALLNEYCAAVAQANELEAGYPITGRCTKKGHAEYLIHTEWSSAELEQLYALNRDSLRALWADLARDTRSLCAEKGFTAIDEITVAVFPNESIQNGAHYVTMTTHETNLI